MYTQWYVRAPSISPAFQSFSKMKNQD
uniref:Uncharacterized protein n=1 Tax=Arundo donax TaxID=35708 RepID=A0A0A9C4X1_ARUDO